MKAKMAKATLTREHRDAALAASTRLQIDGSSYARALNDTTRRYLDGHMTKGTWKKHVTSLWAAAVHKGVQDFAVRAIAAELVGHLKGVIK